MHSSTTPSNLFAIFTDRLESIGVRYMVTGSVAGMVYGEPRLTHDVDLVLELRDESAAAALVSAFPLDEFYCAPLEVVRVESGRASRGHFNIIHHETGFKADVYLAGRDALHLAALRDRRAVEIRRSPRTWCVTATWSCTSSTGPGRPRARPRWPAPRRRAERRARLRWPVRRRGAAIAGPPPHDCIVPTPSTTSDPTWVRLHRPRTAR